MIASGRQTAPPLSEVVSVTSACRAALEAESRFIDSYCAAPPGCSGHMGTPPAGLKGSMVWAEMSQHLASAIPVEIVSGPGASASFILSAPEVSTS